jgi:hypothetical protein
MREIVPPIRFNATLQTLFRTQLSKEWAEKYPQLFDQNDISVALAQPKYHFLEWLTAIVYFRTLGYGLPGSKCTYSGFKQK